MVYLGTNVIRSTATVIVAQTEKQTEFEILGAKQVAKNQVIVK